MPYLTVGSGSPVTVPVILGRPAFRDQPVGGIRASFSGPPRSSVRGYVRIWEGIESDWITRATSNAIQTALKAATPTPIAAAFTTATLGLLENLREVANGRTIIGGVNTEIVRIAFDLWETTA